MSIKYRKLNTYKYSIMEDVQIEVNIKPNTDVICTYMELSINGILTIRKGYAWDGPSGPMIDTPDTMRGSLVHDVLYQMMRLNMLPLNFRKNADEMLKQICIEDGMSEIRAIYMYEGVRLFGEQYAKPTPQPEIQIYTAP